MLIERVTWGPLYGGMLSGIMAYQVQVTGDEGSPKEIADVLMAIHQHPCGMGKFVSLYGYFTEKNALDINTFVEALKGYGYRVGIASLGGRYVFPYFRNVQYTSVWLEPDTIWAGFPCNEIVYRVREIGDLVEPTLPGDVTNTALFVQASQNVPSAEVFKFVVAAKHVWHMIVPGRYHPKEEVYSGLDEG